MSYEVVIGLEVHAQLSTESKLFSTSGTAFGASANAQTDVVCLGMPGVLPVLNKKAVQLAVKAGLALDCEVHQSSQFSRKHYFFFFEETWPFFRGRRQQNDPGTPLER